MAVTLPDWRVVSGSFDGGTGGTPRPFEEVPIGTKDGVNRTFRLSYTPWLRFLQLFVNGDQQSKLAPRFSLSGNIVTFAIAPTATDELYCWYFRGGSVAALTARGFGSEGVGSSDVVDWGESSLYKITGDLSIGVWMELPSNAAGWIVVRGVNTSGAGGSYALGVDGSAGAWSIIYLHDTGGGGAHGPYDQGRAREMGGGFP